MSVEYDLYLEKHKANVRKGFEWMQENLPELFTDGSEWQIEFAHDASKSEPDEYEAYDAYFYGGNRSYKVVEDFRKAWLLHIHRNPHHWQHWVLINDEPEESEIVLEMPYNDILEMVCDWWSFAWEKGNLTEIFEWYEEHKSYIKLGDKTRKTVEDILGKMKKKLSEIDSSELAHHGVRGMHWGIRRYQNYDGSLTESGKRRRKSNDFERAEQDVINNCSNTYKTLTKPKAIDISSVKIRSGLSGTDARKVSSIASQKFEEASKIEPRITKDVVNAVSKSNCKMYGLEHRLKQPTSLAGKIGSNAKKKDISFEDASKSIKDAIRYTVVSDTENFVTNYQDIKNSLENVGYSETKVKNYFEKYRSGEVMHKAVQCIYVNSNGYEFEIQFQTPASQAAKELKIPLYEERRSANISSERALELESEMRDLAENVEDPPRIEKIKSN